jgi:ferritin-like metal-binding protein YciE
MKNDSPNREFTGRADNSGPMSEDMHDLFLDELADLYSAEKQLTRVLPKLAEAARSQELKTAIASHLQEAQQHMRRLEQAAESLDEELPDKNCPAMEGLIKEASELLAEQKGKSTLDAAIIAAAQKVEHHQIASYGTVRAWAEQMGHNDAAQWLQKALDEESAADERLSEIAMTSANQSGGR